MKYSQEEFEAMMNAEIRSLVTKYSQQFIDKIVPTVEEIELMAEKITTDLVKITTIPTKTLISRFLGLYYLSK